MSPRDTIEFLNIIEQLKCRTRHCCTSSGRTESVAEHSHRLAVFAWLIKDEVPDMDIDKVIRMSLFHDLGEAVTGDIPAFMKTESDEVTEAGAVAEVLKQLSPGLRMELEELFLEMEEQQTPEAKLWKALDKMEAVIQHNESDISTWLPLEYDLQKSHGIKESGAFEYTRQLRRLVNEQVDEKIAKNQ